MTTTRASRRNVSLANAFREFIAHPSPWMIATFALGALVARLLVGSWSWLDAAIPVILLAVSPLVEWLIHVGILHWRPRRIGRLTIDSLLAREHRAHHRDPRDVPLIFIPWPVLVWLLPALTAIGVFAFRPVGHGLTFLLTVTSFLLAYEWTHYLIHTDYKPKTRLYRATWRNHRFHHYKNEHYWFTVTTTGTADRLLHTYPDPADVEKSPTAKDLHARG